MLLTGLDDDRSRACSSGASRTHESENILAYASFFQRFLNPDFLCTQAHSILAPVSTVLNIITDLHDTLYERKVNFVKLPSIRFYWWL
jgi:hypothetical protein